jgi:DNA-binding response OmpR family regulator
VVVLNRDLPGLHGDTICRTITDSGKAVMVLIFTAAGTPADRATGRGLGADRYLPTPFHFPELGLRLVARESRYFVAISSHACAK